ncbi:MAG: hypothetical protein IIB76_10700 [Proteobacteria bacterium]|nr:hypothetical protein [Pseudomonadota bacterium]
MDSKTERFFSWVWRINGLLVFLAVTLFLISFGVFAFNSGIFAGLDRPETPLTDVAGVDLAAEDLKLDRFKPLTGTAFLFAKLAAPAKYVGSGTSGATGMARNLLFFDTGSKTAHWLLPNTNHDILTQWFVHDRPFRGVRQAGAAQPIVIGLLLEIAEHVDHPDTEQLRKLVFVSVDGKSITTISESIERLIGQRHVDAKSLLIFYVRDGSVSVIDLDPAEVIVRSDSVLAVD